MTTVLSNPSPEWLREARRTLGLTRTQMAALIGYRSNFSNGDGSPLRTKMYLLEKGMVKVNDAQRRLIEAYLLGYRPPDWPVDA